MKFTREIFVLTLAGSVSAQESILNTVVNSPDHNTLEAAVIAAPAAIAETLGNEDLDLTLFAPDDAAFATLPDGTVELLTSDPWVGHLACVLLGHVHPDAGVPSTAITGPLTVGSALEAYDLNLDRDGETVTVNDIAVSAADIQSTNGFIHSLSDGVLLPPCVSQNIPAALTAAGTFTTLLSLVGAAGLGDALSGSPTAEGLTVMAPNDDAFGDVPQAVLDYLGSNVTALTEVLTYHVIAANVVPTESGTVTTLQGEDITVTVDGDDITLNDSSMVEGSVLASNGLYHEIDTVLLPPTFMMPDTPMPTSPPSGAAKASLFAAAAAGVVALFL